MTKSTHFDQLRTWQNHPDVCKCLRRNKAMIYYDIGGETGSVHSLCPRPATLDTRCFDLYHQVGCEDRVALWSYINLTYIVVDRCVCGELDICRTVCVDVCVRGLTYVGRCVCMCVGSYLHTSIRPRIPESEMNLHFLSRSKQSDLTQNLSLFSQIPFAQLVMNVSFLSVQSYWVKTFLELYVLGDLIFEVGPHISFGLIRLMYCLQMLLMIFSWREDSFSCFWHLHV